MNTDDTQENQDDQASPDNGNNGDTPDSSPDSTSPPPSPPSPHIGFLFAASKDPYSTETFIYKFIDANKNKITRIYDYKNDPTAISYTPSECMKIMASKDDHAKTKMYTEFLGTYADARKTSDPQKFNTQKSAAIYVDTTTTYKDLKETFVEDVEGYNVLTAIGWHLKPYYGTEVHQKPVGFLMGKNPDKSYAPGLIARINAGLQKLQPKLPLVSWTLFNEPNSKKERTQVLGIMINNSSTDLFYDTVKKAGGKIDGLGIRLKCEKQNMTTYSKSVDVITTLKKKSDPQDPKGVTALRVSNLTPAGSQHLRKRLHDPTTIPAYNPTYPIDLEDTHLSIRRGKYMVVIDVKQKDIVKTFLDQELQLPVYQNTLFHDPPAVIEDEPLSDRPRHDTDDASEITMDPYAGMIDLQPTTDPPSVSTEPSTMTFAQRRQRAIESLPTACVVIDFDASKFSSPNPPTTFANAAKGTKSQGSLPASEISQLTQLTEENSKLEDEVSSLKQSLQDQDEKFHSALETTKADHKAAMDAKDSRSHQPNGWASLKYTGI